MTPKPFEMAKKRKPLPEPKPEPQSDSSSSSSSYSEYEEIEEEFEVTESDSESDSESQSESEPEALKEEVNNVQSSNEDDEEEVMDCTDRDALKRLVEPFSKEQLMTLLTEAAMKNPKVLSIISSSAQSDPEHRKIFVHGLSYEAKSEDLEQAFSPFGSIEEVTAICDRTTGRCKGYGFVLFQHRTSALNALKDPQKRIGERTVSCQLASRGPQQKPRHHVNQSLNPLAGFGTTRPPRH